MLETPWQLCAPSAFAHDSEMDTSSWGFSFQFAFPYTMCIVPAHTTPSFNFYHHDLKQCIMIHLDNHKKECSTSICGWLSQWMIGGGKLETPRSNSLNISFTGIGFQLLEGAIVLWLHMAWPPEVRSQDAWRASSYEEVGAQPKGP